MIVESIPVIFVIVVVAGSIWQRSNEKKDWNNGKCPNCSTKWNLFDYDSQGGRGYNCPSCNNYMWASYKVDNQY